MSDLISQPPRRPLIVRWIRRRTAESKQRALRYLRRHFGPPEPPAEKRRKWLEAARRDPSIKVEAKVVELPAQASGSAQVFAEPSILILQLAHMGDFVLSLRAAKKIRDGFPGSRITLVCASWNEPWARAAGLFDEIVAFDFFSRMNQDWNGPTRAMFDGFAALGLGRFDIAIDLRHDADTRPCLHRVAAKARVGYFAPREPGFPPLDLMLPEVEGVVQSDGSEYSLHAELRLGLLADAVVDAYGGAGRAHPMAQLAGVVPPAGSPFAIFAVGAGDSIRRWPQQNFIALGREIIERYNLDIAVVGGAAEAEIVAAIVAALPQGRAVAALNLPLMALTTRIAQAAAVVGLGSGVSHLAATLGVPTVALLSGVSPLSVWRPVGPRVVNFTGQTPCTPCGLRHERDCPFDVVCLTSITPEHVLAATERLLRAPAPG